MVRACYDVRDELGLLRIGHGWFEDADDGRDAWTETDRLANHGWVALEHRRPEPVYEHHPAGRSRAIISGVQQAAEHRARSPMTSKNDPLTTPAFTTRGSWPKPINVKSTVEKSRMR